MNLGSYRIMADILGFNNAGILLTGLNRLGLLKQELKTYYVVSTDPIIIYIGNVMKNIMDISEVLRDKKVYYIKNSYHQFNTEERLSTLRKEFVAHKEQYPEHDIVFICPSVTEYDLFGIHNLEPRHFVNKNCFIDENQYHITPGKAKIYDAVYNAQIVPFKRHDLSAKVERLSLIGSVDVKMRNAENKRYYDGLREKLGHAHWCNDWLSMIRPCEIKNYLNRQLIASYVSVSLCAI